MYSKEQIEAYFKAKFPRVLFKTNAFTTASIRFNEDGAMDFQHEDEVVYDSESDFGILFSYIHVENKREFGYMFNTSDIQGVTLTLTKAFVEADLPEDHETIDTIMKTVQKQFIVDEPTIVIHLDNGTFHHVDTNVENMRHIILDTVVNGENRLVVDFHGTPYQVESHNVTEFDTELMETVKAARVDEQFVSDRQNLKY